MRELNPETLRLLQRLYRQSRHHQVRQRAHCLILSTQSLTIAQLTGIFGVTRKTLYNWFNAWEERGVVGLYDRPGRGRKPTLTSVQKEQICSWAKQYPKQLKQILQKVQEEWGITVSIDTIKRVLKAMRMRSASPTASGGRSTPTAGVCRKIQTVGGVETARCSR